MDFSTPLLWLIYVLIFALGTVLGSFANVVVYRLSTQTKGILFGRSFCPHCKHSLGPLDLIPLLSYLQLKGKCRYCASPISKQYPLVEAVMGGVFLYIFLALAGTAALQPTQLVLYWFYAFLLVTISVYDLYHYAIPDILIFLGIGLAGVLAVGGAVTALPAPALVDAVFGVLIAVLFFGGQVWISRETWLGWGDVLIGIFMGLALGWKLTLVAMFFSYIIGSVVGVLLIALKKKKGNSQIPFGPFLSIGTLIALGSGQQLLNWYLGLI